MMYKGIAVFLLILSNFCLYAQTKEQASVRILELLKKYDTDGYNIVTRYDNCTTCHQRLKKIEFVDWLFGKYDEATIVNDLSTVVHEISHAYIDALEIRPDIPQDGKRYYRLYMNSDKDYIIELTKTFPSSEIKDEIIPELRNVRYKEYILGKSSTQSSGIYGLTDEWNAYYHGLKNDLSLYQYYVDNNATPEEWFNAVMLINANFYVYYEFKCFILRYLIFAKEHHPDVYEGILNNKVWKVCFLEIDEKFGKLMTDFANMKVKVFKMLEDKGYTIYEDKDMIALMKDGGGTGRGTDNKTYQALLTELQKPEYAAMIKEIQK